MARTQKETRELVTQLRVAIGEGLTDAECADRLGVQTATLISLKQQLYSDELSVTSNETAGENWVRYHLRMKKCMDDLDDVVLHASKLYQGKDAKTGALSAAVGAVRAKAELMEKVFLKGQELGVIPTVAPEEDTNVPKQGTGLAQLVKEKTEMLKEMGRKYGTMDYRDLPMPAEDTLHFEESDDDDEDTETRSVIQ